MKKQAFKQKFDSLVIDSGKILITTHQNPDEDAISSALSTKSYIEKKFSSKNVEIKITDGRNIQLNHLENFHKIKYIDDIKNIIDNFDLLVFVDGNAHYRFSNKLTAKDIENSKSIAIDHHTDEKINYELKYIETGKSSCAELVYELLIKNDSDVKVDEELAKEVLTGILGDTAGLRYIRKNNSSTLLTVKELVELGDLNLEKMLTNQFQMSSDVFEGYRELVKNTQNITLKNKGVNLKLTYSFIEKDKFFELKEKYGDINDSIYKVNILRLIEGHNFGFIVMPEDESSFKISFRSQPGAPNVRLLAEQFEIGGGHDPAAGASYEPTEEEIKDGFDSKDLCDKVIKIIENSDLVLI